MIGVELGKDRGAPVDQLHLFGGRVEDQIAGFDVAVNDGSPLALGVGSGAQIAQQVGELGGYVQDQLRGSRPALRP